MSSMLHILFNFFFLCNKPIIGNKYQSQSQVKQIFVSEYYK
jgi:hypothetical protein